ncbi:uncharacterized protein PV09_00777 [Verruconis gallopava]|uniref:Uncharacterized protein n=1 Tax=Verruconis gallopava TaxID=253628 RepID=A0A0D1Z7B1_9PEZI|nr:uncharacterized protein PV09_00777 [Verruconis gallopava]KIW08852.1 hypothetical protein PV09_00777 [Verruconis gallopava]
MDQALRSPAVQRALPDLAGLHTTFGFDRFLASPPPTITSDPKSIRELFRGYAVQMERHERFTDLWKHQYANQLVNLRQLITAFDNRRLEIEEAAAHDESLAEDIETRMLGSLEFEDLYYFLACKTRTLYSDLQLRFVSDFITMDTVLHRRGGSSYAHAACTVRDFRNFLRAVWFHLLHPVIVRTIEASINHRKYQVLKANPLLPSWNLENTTQEERDSIQKYEKGLNLDASTMSTLFGRLEDVSALSIPALLMKVSAHELQLRDTLSEEQTSHASDRGSSAFVERARFATFEGDTKGHIASDLQEIGTQKPELRAESGHQRSKSDNASSRLSRRPDRRPKSSFVLLDNDSLRKTDVKAIDGGDSACYVTTGLSQLVPDDGRGRSSIQATSQSSEDRLPPSPEVPRQSARFCPSLSPCSYRMPFHGDEQFPHDPPTPPPKSASLLARAKERELEARLKRLERIEQETWRLQDALRQVQALQRENSRLQERLLLTSAPPSTPKGLFRRLSRARGRSPGKSLQ